MKKEFLDYLYALRSEWDRRNDEIRAKKESELDAKTKEILSLQEDAAWDNYKMIDDIIAEALK